MVRTETNETAELASTAHRSPLGSSNPPPFGTRRNNRVAYSINLSVELANAVDRYLANSPVQTTYGCVAVEAIRCEWRSLFRELQPLGQADDLFPLRRINHGRLVAGDPMVRKVFYVTNPEAWAIDAVQQRLGNIELGQLHRLALASYLQ